jgi:hypothetical protein
MPLKYSRKLSTGVRQVHTFGSTYKPVIYIDCQFYGRVLRYASKLIYYFHLQLIHYSTTSLNIITYFINFSLVLANEFARTACEFIISQQNIKFWYSLLSITHTFWEILKMYVYIYVYGCW